METQDENALKLYKSIFRKIINSISIKLNLEKKRVSSRSTKPKIVLARGMATYMTYKLIDCTMKDIAALLNYCSVAEIEKAIENFSYKLQQDEELNLLVKNLIHEVEHKEN